MRARMNILSDEEVRAIDRASRELLRTTGVNMHNEEALDLFRKAGADVSGARVRIPGHLFARALACCNPLMRAHARDGHPPVTLGGMRPHYGTGGFATQCLDGDTWQYRSVVEEDLVRMARLYDVLERPHFGITSATPTDVDSSVSDLHEFRIMATNTRKHLLVQCKDARHLEKMLDMAGAVSGMSRAEMRAAPWFSLMICITSPLFVRSELCELVMAGARAGVPLIIEAGPMAGATAPATLAHALIHTNAENWAVITLAKLVNPEIPFVYASWSRTFDMKSATVCHGGPEFGMLRMATTQMAKFYNLPSGGGGMLTDSKLIDGQYGFEKLSTTLLPALAGTNIILGMGLTADQDALSLEALVVDEEITRYVDRILSGVRVEDATTDLGIIEKVGPEGFFIEEPHTLENYKQEMWIPRLCDRTPATHGLDMSRKSMLLRTRKQVEKALASWTRPRMPEDAEARCREIIARETL